MLENCETLDECELKLSAELRDVSLIGQVPLSDEDLGKLGALLSRWLRGNDVVACGRPSASLACLLVWVGVRGYSRGEYWPAVGEALGAEIRGHLYADLTGGFLEFLSAHRLPTFEEAEGLHYVTPILAHGGVPDYCLTDFFKHLLLPVATGRLNVDINDPSDIVAEWREHSSYFDFTDKPVRRFLLHGSRAASDFLSRCVEMAVRAASEGIVPSPQELGLPARVVERFEDWWTQERSVQPAAAASRQWRRPSLIFVPEYGEVCLRVPRQRVAAQPTRFRVSILADGRPVEPVELQARYSRGAVELEEERIALPVVARQYSASIVDESNTSLRAWQMQALREGLEAIAFAETGLAVLGGELPQAPVWLLLPRDVTVGRPARIVEEGPPLYGGWADYRAYLVDLSGMNRLTLLRGREEIAVPVESDGISEPRLVPRSTVRTVLSDEASVHTRPPFLTVPSPEDASRWQIAVVPVGNATLDHRISMRLSDARLGLVSGGQQAVDLADSALLGSGAAGQFVIRMRGPLGSDRHHRIAIVPGLRVRCDRTLYVPQRRTFESPEAQVRVSGTGLQTLSCQPPCTASESDNGWTIHVPGNEERAELDVEVQAVDRLLRVPLTLLVPRLRLGIRRSETTPAEWSSSTPELSVYESTSLREGVLLVDAPTDGQTRATLRLAGSRHLVRQPLRRGKTRFDLADFTDSLRHLPQSSALFQLALVGDGDRVDDIPALIVRVRWGPEGLSISSNRVGHRWALRLGWRERSETEVRGRVLRLWNTWRPWQQAEVVPIPDGETEVEVDRPASGLTPGVYRIEFSVQDPWEISRPRHLPGVDGEVVFDVEIGDPRERDEYVSSLCGDLTAVLEKLIAVRSRHPHNVELLIGQTPLPSSGIGEDEAEALVHTLLAWVPDVDYRGGEVRMLWERLCAHFGRETLDGLLLARLDKSRSLGDRSVRQACDRLRVFVDPGEPDLPFEVGEVVEHTERGSRQQRVFRYVGRQDMQGERYLVLEPVSGSGREYIPLTRYHLLRRVDPGSARPSSQRRGRRRSQSCRLTRSARRS